MPRIDSAFGVVIPTKNRPEGMRRLLCSMQKQQVWPGQIVIVDSGDAPLDAIVSEFDYFRIHYVRHKPSSLPQQRNVGINHLDSEIQIVAFFDDDVQLCPHAIDSVMAFWLSCPKDTAGVACNNVSHHRSPVTFLERVFMVGSDHVGTILPSGFQSKICSLDKDYPVKWLIGGATFWKRSIFSEYAFDEWFRGYAHCEDVDFSYRVSKKYKLFAVKGAAFLHDTASVQSASEYHLGKMQVMNRVYFVKKHREFLLPLCYWSCLGLFLKNVFLGIVRCKKRCLFRGWGVFAGIMQSLYRLEQIDVEIKK